MEPEGSLPYLQVPFYILIKLFAWKKNLWKFIIHDNQLLITDKN
jgi:hypothetical protein